MSMKKATFPDLAVITSIRESIKAENFDELKNAVRNNASQLRTERDILEMTCGDLVDIVDLTRPPRRVTDPSKSMNEYMYLEESLLSDDLACPICTRTLQQVVVVKECLHRFCSPCIEKWLRLGHQDCPQCRRKIPSRRSLRRDPIFEKMVSRLFPNAQTYEAQSEAIIREKNQRKSIGELKSSFIKSVSFFDEVNPDVKPAENTTSYSPTPAPCQTQMELNLADAPLFEMLKLMDGARTPEELSMLFPRITNLSHRLTKRRPTYVRVTVIQNLPFTGFRWMSPTQRMPPQVLSIDGNSTIEATQRKLTCAIASPDAQLFPLTFDVAGYHGNTMPKMLGDFCVPEFMCFVSDRARELNLAPAPQHDLEREYWKRWLFFVSKR